MMDKTENIDLLGIRHALEMRVFFVGRMPGAKIPARASAITFAAIGAASAPTIGDGTRTTIPGHGTPAKA